MHYYEGGRFCPSFIKSNAQMGDSHECQRHLVIFGVCKLLQKIYSNLCEHCIPTNHANKQGCRVGLGFPVMRAFESLKTALCSAPLIISTNPSILYIVVWHASREEEYWCKTRQRHATSSVYEPSIQTYWAMVLSLCEGVACGCILLYPMVTIFGRMSWVVTVITNRLLTLLMNQQLLSWA